MNETIETTEPHTEATNIPPVWITIAQLQERYGIGRSAAYSWAHNMPKDVCVRIGERRLLINERKLIAYLEQKGTHQTLRQPKGRGRR